MKNQNSLLPLFKGQLEAESAKIGSDLGTSKRGTFLIYWYFMKLHAFTESEVAEIICDGGMDLGIDAIWIDEKELVHFYQFKNPEGALKGIPGGEIDKMISGLRANPFPPAHKNRQCRASW